MKKDKKYFNEETGEEIGKWFGNGIRIPLSKIDESVFEIDRSLKRKEKTFSEQVGNLINGKLNRNNHVIVMKHTPVILQKLGCND